MHRNAAAAGSLSIGLLIALAAASHASGAPLVQQDKPAPQASQAPADALTAAPEPEFLEVASTAATTTATPAPPAPPAPPVAVQEAVPPTLIPPAPRFPSDASANPAAGGPEADPALAFLPARGWSIPRNISNTDALSDWPAVAVDDDGSLYVVWAEGPIGTREIYFATNVLGSWSPPVNLSGSPTVDSYAPDVAVDAEDGANIVWQEGAHESPVKEVMFTRCVGVACGPAPLVVSNGRCSPYVGNWAAWMPSIVVGEDGLAMLIWMSQEPGGNRLPFVVWEPPASVPTEITGCVPYSGALWMPDLAAGPSGQRRLVWESYDLGWIYHANRASGSWSASFVGSGNTPRVATDDTGNSHVVWCRTGAVRYRYWNGSVWNTEEAISTATSCGGPPAVAVRGDGLVQAAWESRSAGTRVVQSVRNPGGWTEPEDISESTAGAEDPALTADLEGRLHLVWADSREGEFDILYTKMNPDAVDVPMGLAPDAWTMVLSIRPTLRWDAVEEAEVFRLRLYRSTDGQQVSTRLFDGAVVAATSHDPDSSLRHLVRLEDELTTGSTLSEAGYFWFVDALGSSGEVLAASTIASFQIPPLGGAWEDIRGELCKNADCDDKDGPNPFWDLYDTSIYRWAEFYDIPAPLLKAIFIGETASALGPREIDGQYFAPTRAYLYEPYVDWESNSGNLVLCAGSCSEFCLPEHPPNQTFEGLGPFPYPYDREVTGEPTIPEYATHVGYSFSNRGRWGLERIPGCAPDDPDPCLADDFKAQYRVGASYGLGQIVYAYEWSYLNQFEEFVRPGNPPSIIPPELLYDADLNIRVSAFLLSQKRASPYLANECPGIRADSEDYEEWRGPLLFYNGGGNEKYDDTAIYRAKNFTAPHDLALVEPETWAELHPHPCAPQDASRQAIESGRPLPEDEVTEVAGRSIDLREDGDPVWVGLVVFDTGTTGVMEGEVRIYEDESRTDLLWESKRIENVNPVGWVRDVPSPGGRLALADWAAGMHASRTYPVVWIGEAFELLPAHDEFGDETDGIGSDAGGVFPYPDGSLVSVQNTYGPTSGERQVTVWESGGADFTPVRSLVYDTEQVDTTPPETAFYTVPEVNAAGWLKAASEVHLTATDDLAVESITYNLLGYEPQVDVLSPLDHVVFAAPEGSWTLFWLAADMSSNKSSTQIRSLKVDATAPEIQVHLEGDEAGLGRFSSSVTVTLETFDPALADGSPSSGVERLEYSLDAGLNWVEYSVPFTIDTPGTTTVLCRAFDIAGNVAEENVVVSIGTPLYLPLVTR